VAIANSDAIAGKPKSKVAANTKCFFIFFIMVINQSCAEQALMLCYA
jgi:hypothetical protein